MSDSELIDAQTAVELLGCTPEELQEKIANKELRAFRSGGQMKFRREDVEEMRASRSTEPTIILPSTRKPGASGILQALNDDLAMPQQAPAPIAAPVTNYGGFQGDPSGTQPIVIDDLDILPVSQDGMTTQDMTAAHTAVQNPIGGDDLTVVDANMTVVDDLDHTVIDEMDQPGVRAGQSAVQRVTRTQTRADVVPSARRAQAIYVKSPSNPIMSICLVITTLILSYAFAVMLTHVMYDPYQTVQLPNGETSGERYIPGFVQWGTDQFKTIMYESKK
ncbi:MAG TPA: excisionase family DNA-binding protein [Planctomycetota bacterium]|nr:excisionase family DNA-binding protein [Planctomycetota bacterium]